MRGKNRGWLVFFAAAALGACGQQRPMSVGSEGKGVDGLGRVDDIPANGADFRPSTCSAPPPPAGLKVLLPQDEQPHREVIEWWYWTGHLVDDDGHEYGFEHVIFLAGKGGVWLQEAHHAVTDVRAGTFQRKIDVRAGYPTVVPGGYSFAVGKSTVAGANGHDVLHGQVDGYTLDLTADSLKPTVYQHEIGYTDYSFGGYTYYYSRERLGLRGTLVKDGVQKAVRGLGWFDHQWGNLSLSALKGWNWFAMILDDNREIMVFDMRVATPASETIGSYTDADCATEALRPEDVTVSSFDTWTSPHTLCTYPSGWDVVVKGMYLHLTPVVDDQEVIELVLPTYWEGKVAITGDATGEGYVELNGYCFL